MRRLVFCVALMILGASLSACDCGDDDTAEGGGNGDDDVVDDDALDDDVDDDTGDDDTWPPIDDDEDDDLDDDVDDDADDDADDDTTCPDGDADGYTDQACGGEDCDDGDGDVHPGVYDVCGDGRDNDCDGTTDNPPIPDVDFPEFLLGMDSSGGDPKVWLPELGIHWFRPTISWVSFQHDVTDPDLTLADIEADPTIIDDYIDTIDWTGLDNYLGSLVDAGLSLLPIVGHGYTTTLAFIDGERATPDRLGREHYLAQQYREVRAVVERYDGDGYKDADGIVIKFWQTENELNQAMLTGVYGWREPAGLDAFGSAWGDWDFLTDLLAVEYAAVHDADPEAVTTQNLHTDIHPNYSPLLGQPSWIEAAALWRDYVDAMGFDAYPNYYDAEPLRGDVVGERAATIAEASCGLPVLAMEIGYPKGPSELGFSPALQAQFIQEAYDSAVDAGVAGYFHFGLQSADADSVDITPDYVAALDDISQWFNDGRVLPILIYALQHLDLLSEDLLDVLQAVESYWGLVDNEGVRQPGFYTLQDIAAGL